MARAVGKLIDSDYFHPFYHDDTVTIELPRGMKVIGKREDCQYFNGSYGSGSVAPNQIEWAVCKHKSEKSISVFYCPCHNWKARKK